MNSDPIVTVSWDYLVEFSDDGTQPSETASEVVMLPPTPKSTDPAPAPTNTPKP